MSEFGLKIKNYEAGSVYEVQQGVRFNYDSKDAMLTNSLFLDYMLKHGLDAYKDVSTRDIICIEFKYGSRSYNSEINHLNKLLDDDKHDNDKIKHLINEAEKNKDKYIQKTSDEIRELFYTSGVDIRYPKFNRQRDIVGFDTIHYKMLYRTPGKAKRGSCMFIREELYNIAHNFLWMGIELPFENAPIVEMGAYSSLVTSTIVGRVKIEPHEILILKDVESFMTAPAISVETNEYKECIAVHYDNYKIGNVLFDGQALIDSSIFPSYGDGYILLRQHFFKAAAFCSNIQLFFKDYFGEGYETATVEDMWGNKHLAKDIKLITTDNAIKWLKFNISFDYWSEWVRLNGSLFGIVKTAHESKLGNVQRMSYQMVNALNMDAMNDVSKYTYDYIMQLKLDDNCFLEFLKKGANYANGYDVLVALCEHNPDFIRTDYFRERKKLIISDYTNKVRLGKIINNADNLVIVGSPYAMLLHSVGDDCLKDPTFKVEDGCTQCWTGRFDDGEYLAEFRNPFNSRNNLGYLHNCHHEYFDKYFVLGKQIIAINMIGTDFQNKNNGLTKWLSVQKCA